MKGGYTIVILCFRSYLGTDHLYHSRVCIQEEDGIVALIKLLAKPTPTLIQLFVKGFSLGVSIYKLTTTAGKRK